MQFDFSRLTPIDYIIYGQYVLASPGIAALYLLGRVADADTDWGKMSTEDGYRLGIAFQEQLNAHLTQYLPGSTKEPSTEDIQDLFRKITKGIDN